jgi:hypothetical protein
MTIQSSSRRISRPSCIGSLLRREAATLRASSPIVLSRVLGRGGSSSRMIRLTSSNAALFSRSPSTGVVPVNSS